MIPEYISPPIDLVLQISFIVILASFIIAKLAHVPFRPKFWLMVVGAAMLATAISLVYSYKFRGGDYFWLRRGYPHYFWGIGDVVGFPDMTPSNALLGFDTGPLGIYLLGDVVFYASLFLCAYVIFFATRDRIRAL